MKTNTTKDVCDYLSWAHFNHIDLAGDPQTLKDFDAVSQICNADYYHDMTQLNLEFDMMHNHLMSSELLDKLTNYIDVSQSADRAEGLHPHELPLGFVNY